MLLPLLSVPIDLRQSFESFTGNLPWSDIEFHVGALPGAMTPRALVLPELQSPDSRLKAVATTIGTEIYVSPEYYDTQSAAGLSLMVHELVHVQQYLTVPNFLQEYHNIAVQTDPERPWENPFEWEAYVTECQAYDYYLSQGFPPGDWIPLGHVVGFCDEPV